MVGPKRLIVRRNPVAHKLEAVANVRDPKAHSALVWMAEKARQVNPRSTPIQYQFRAQIPLHMLQSITEVKGRGKGYTVRRSGKKVTVTSTGTPDSYCWIIEAEAPTRDKKVPIVFVIHEYPKQRKNPVTKYGEYDPDLVKLLRGPPVTPTSKAFTQWFGKSQVTNSIGKPLVVWHGTPDARWVKKGVMVTVTRDGTYFFAEDYKTALSYADDSRAFDYQNAIPAVIPVYLRMLDPKVILAGGKAWQHTEHHIEQAKTQGHDGIIIYDSLDPYQHTYGEKPTTVYVVFSSNQVKLADGREGPYGETPNILNPKRPRNPKQRKNPLTDVVYHKVSLSTAVDIVESNKLMTSPAYGTAPDAAINKGYLYFVSFMRSPQSGYRRGQSSHAILIQFNGRKLNERYAGGPVDYWGPTYRKGDPGVYEMEDRLFTDKEWIPDVHRYITAFHVAMVEPMNFDVLADQVAELEFLEQAAKKWKIPFYIYTKKSSWKALRSPRHRTVSGWLNACSKEIKEPSPYRSSREMGDYTRKEFEGFVATLQAVLAYRKGDKKAFEKLGKGPHKEFLSTFTGYQSEQASKLSNLIHGHKSDPQARPYFAEIRKGMSALKKRTPETLVKEMHKTIDEENAIRQKKWQEDRNASERTALQLVLAHKSAEKAWEQVAKRKAKGIKTLVEPDSKKRVPLQMVEENLSSYRQRVKEYGGYGPWLEKSRGYIDYLPDHLKDLIVAARPNPKRKKNPKQKKSTSQATTTALSLLEVLSMADAIAAVKKRGGNLVDPVTRSLVPSTEVLIALNALKISPLKQEIRVYHATSPDVASLLMQKGFRPQLKPRSRVKSYAPGRGIDPGLYVGASPQDVESYGKVILGVSVPRSSLAVPTELSQLGYSDPWEALNSHDGAVINQAIPPQNFTLLKNPKRRKNPKHEIGSTVGALEVTEDIPNMGSLSASYDEDEYEVKGLRLIPVSKFGKFDKRIAKSGYSYGAHDWFYSRSDLQKAKALKKAITQNRWIDPLIVGEDDEGLFVLEGQHRYVALRDLGASHIPALFFVEQSLPLQPNPKRRKNPKFKVGDRVSEGKRKGKVTALHSPGTVDVLFDDMGYAIRRQAPNVRKRVNPSRIIIKDRISAEKVHRLWKKLYLQGKHKGLVDREPYNPVFKRATEFFLVSVPHALYDAHYQEDFGLSPAHKKRSSQYAKRKSALPPGIATYSSRSFRRKSPTLFVSDGNHRAFASFLRGDQTFNLYVPVSDMKLFEKNFPHLIQKPLATARKR